MKRSTLAIVISLFFALNASAQDSWVTEVLRQIEANNPQLQSMRKDHAATMAEMKAENTLGETAIEYTPFFQKGADGMASSELVVSQEFDFPTIYGARRQHETMRQTMLDRDYDSARSAILLEAALLCCDIMAAKEQSDLLTVRLAASDSLLSVCHRRMTLGTATIMEENRAKLDRMVINTELAKTEGEKRRIMLRLKEMGMTTEPALPSRYECVGTLPMLRNMDVLQAEASLAESGQVLKMARQSWLPKLSVGYRRNTELHEYALNGVLVGVSMPLFSNSKNVKAARLRQEARESELDAAQKRVEWRRTTLQTQLTNLTEQLKTYDHTVMEQSLSTLMKAVKAGQISITEYYTETERIYQMMQSEAEIRNEINKTTVELNTL